MRAGHARPLRGGERKIVGRPALRPPRRGQDPSLRCGVRRGGKAVTGGYGKARGPGMPGPYGVMEKGGRAGINFR